MPAVSRTNSRDSGKARGKHLNSPVTQNGPNGLSFHGAILSYEGHGVDIEETKSRLRFMRNRDLGHARKTLDRQVQSSGDSTRR
jgi:hypothetical protein